ncbi:MAG: hypothetical protein KDE26_26970, partial [Bacteroidetes bacterium]|nr:hypothetical protein [Bacteroidota bacterium]
ILFKQRLKQPFRFNFMERLAMRYFRSRFRQISEKRMIQNRTSDTKPYEIKYSGVRVPGDIRFLFIPFYLLFKAVWAYVILEGKELFFRNL